MTSRFRLARDEVVAAIDAGLPDPAAQGADAVWAFEKAHARVLELLPPLQNGSAKREPCPVRL